MKRLDNLTFNSAEVLEQLNANPEFWNFYTLRTKRFTNSPHREVDDIWLRYRDYSDYNVMEPESFSDPHISVYYTAYYVLLSVKSAIDKVVEHYPGCELGGVLITRIPAGKQVYRHNDSGHWHAEYYSTKILILLQSAPGQTFCFDDETHEGKTGDIFKFNNLVDHWVINNSAVDRKSLLISLRETK